MKKSVVKTIPFALPVLCFSLPVFCQNLPFDTSKLQKTDPYEIRSFAFARCKNHFDTTYCIPALPTIIRSNAIGNVFEFDEIIPFKIHWTPWENAMKMDRAWFIQSGRCRGFSFTLPAPVPGIYTIIYQHPVKPCVMQIAITPLDLHQGEHYVEMRFFQRCNPDIIYRRYRPVGAPLNHPNGGPTTIEVFWKPFTEVEALSIPDEEGFELIKIVETSNPAAFNYQLTRYGIYKFRYNSPSRIHKDYEYLTFIPDHYEIKHYISIY